MVKSTYMQKQDMRQKMVMILDQQIQPMMCGNGMKKMEQRQVAQEQYMAFMMFMGIGTQEFLFLALIILLLFGGKKIPELMKGIGKGVRSFKEGMNEVEDNLKETDQKKEETTSNEKKEK